MRMWKIRAVRSVLVFVVDAIGIGLCTHPSAMCDRHFLLGTDRRIDIFVDSSTNRSYNKSFVQCKHRVQQRSYKTNLQQLLAAVCPTLLTDRSY